MEKIEDQAPKEHKKNWREVYASVDEIKDFLANRIFLRHNVITRRVEYRLASSFTQDFMPYWQPIEDRVVNSLWTKMCRIKPTRVQDIFRVIESDYVPDFNPFTDYLEHLPPWDGCNNILVLSASVRVKGGVKKQELFYKYLRKWLVAMVAAWVDPNEVNHIDNPRTTPIDYEAVFSEAYALYQKEDFHHWLNYNEMEQLSVHNETFEATQQELELIRQTFRLPGPGEKGEFITRTGIMQAIGWNPALHLDVNKIGTAMKKLGFERKRTSSERGYVVCRYNEMEKCERKWAMAEIAKDEDDPESDNNDTGDTVFI